MNDIVYFKRHLPHYHSDIGLFFITSRLTGSIPKDISDKLNIEYHDEIIRIQKLVDTQNKIQQLNDCKKKYFDRFDKILNINTSGNFWLKNDEVARIVANELKELDNKEYNLICYCIMPNHFHLLIELNETFQKKRKAEMVDVGIESEKSNFSRISLIMKLIKGRSAYKSNKVLYRTGKFWQHENYDHIIRNSREYYSIINYILMNPVKAGFVKDWTDWEWSYCKYYES